VIPVEHGDRVRGATRFFDDLDEPRHCLHAAVVTASAARAGLERLETTRALGAPGVRAVLTAADIPGINGRDEAALTPLLVEDEIEFAGQPLALVVADSPEVARAAGRLVTYRSEPGVPVLDARLAAERNMLIGKPRMFLLGDLAQGFERCVHCFSGKVDLGAQAALSLERSGALAQPTASGIHILTMTTCPSRLQRAVARLLGVTENRVVVEVPVLCGGVGGKGEDLMPWALLAALGAWHAGCAVKLVLDHEECARLAGSRPALSADFTIGLDENMRIQAYEAVFYQNAGAGGASAERISAKTLFHLGNAYHIANCKATALVCRTNLPPVSDLKGSGRAHGIFVIEAAIAHAAEALGIPAFMIQRRNLLEEGDSFPYGQQTEQCRAQACWRVMETRYCFREMRARIETHNAEHRLTKKGFAVMPICCGIAFPETHLNQADARITIYGDGSVTIHTGTVDQGRGVISKLVHLTAIRLGIDAGRINVGTRSTDQIASASSSDGAASSDLEGKALETACLRLRNRILTVAADLLDAESHRLALQEEHVVRDGRPTQLSWSDLIAEAARRRVGLSELSHYATPHLELSNLREKGSPFAYHVYGAAVIEATLDCLRGQVTIDGVSVVHDGGESLLPTIDRAQIEAGIVQGIGWVSLEARHRDEKGSPHSGRVRVPIAVPEHLEIAFLDEPGSPLALLNAKAVEEPPLIYGVGAYFAARAALRAARPDVSPPLITPLTPARILATLYPEDVETPDDSALPSLSSSSGSQR